MIENFGNAEETVVAIRGDEPLVTDLFAFRPRIGRAGAFEATGARSAVVSMLAARGEELPEDLLVPGLDPHSADRS